MMTRVAAMASRDEWTGSTRATRTYVALLLVPSQLLEPESHVALHHSALFRSLVLGWILLSVDQLYFGIGQFGVPEERKVGLPYDYDEVPLVDRPIAVEMLPQHGLATRELLFSRELQCHQVAGGWP